MNGIDQFLTRKSRDPRLVFTTASADFGDDHETIHIRMKRLFDDLIGHVRTVEIARIDVVHACRNRLSQNSNGAVNITRRSPHLWSGKLHRTIAHAIQGD